MTTLAADLHWTVIASSVLGSVAALCLARRARSFDRLWVAFAWLVVAVGLVCALVVDQTNFRPRLLNETLVTVHGWKISTFEVLAPSIAAIGGAFIIYQLRSHRLACLLILAAVLSAFTNPVTEMEETRLTSNGDNYTFVASDQPYRFTPEASRRLELISSLQELSEYLSMLGVCAGLTVFAFVRPTTESPTAEQQSERTGDGEVKLV